MNNVSEQCDLLIEAVQRVLERYARQNDRPAWPAATTRRTAERLGALVAERGLPPVLPVDEMGTPGEMSAEEVAPLVARVMDGLTAAEDLAKPVQQLVKACFYPEFRKCRDSYRAAEADGTCRRQQWKRVRERISGSHCVDCPYWVELTPAQHERLLAQAWRGDAHEWTEHREGFLPEDFREVRRRVRALAPARR